MPIYALGDLVPQIDPDAWVHPDAVLIGDVRLGPEATVWPGAVLRADFGRIEVGARTSVQDGTVLHTTEQWPTVIGAECIVGHNAHLEGCTVEDRCLIGSGSVVLNRAVVRFGSVVGAQALVPEGREVPERHLALGVPARPTPMDDDEQDRWIDAGVSEYVGAGKRYRDALRRIDDPHQG
ncbi:MAG TPA: gamma carbonic anhydrase family protein [Segeticoccus sp.]|jgi:carbonic anhydrase/acetyltransferase-like protein (isoleucine patch superfamily)|nr:gamma carbonic anhydrase family protein [Segeticoccus sp.]